jgi:hypothetical protein
VFGSEAIIDRHHLDAHGRGDRDRLDQRAAARSPQERATMHVDQDAPGVAGTHGARGADHVDLDASDRFASLGRAEMAPHLRQSIVIVAPPERTRGGDVVAELRRADRLLALDHAQGLFAQQVGRRQRHCWHVDRLRQDRCGRQCCCYCEGQAGDRHRASSSPVAN